MVEELIICKFFGVCQIDITALARKLTTAVSVTFRRLSEPWDLPYSSASQMTVGKLRDNSLNNPARWEYWDNHFHQDFPKRRTIPGKVISGNLTDQFHHIRHFRRTLRPTDPPQMILTNSLDIRFHPTKTVFITGTALVPSKGDTMY